MMIKENSAGPPLLVELRSFDRFIDWRRHTVPANHRMLIERFESESISWLEVERIEGQLLLAKALGQPIEALECLSTLALISKAHLPIIRTEVKRIFAVWHRMAEFGHISSEDKAKRYRATVALKALLKAFPKDRIFNEGMAILLREECGLSAALDYLEDAVVRGAPVADLLCFFIDRALTRPQSASIVRISGTISPWLQKLLGTFWPALALKRAVIFASLANMQPPPTWLSLIEPKIIFEHSNFLETLENILDLLRHENGHTISHILRLLANVDVFWVSSLPGAEDAREKLIESLFWALDPQMTPRDRLNILWALHLCLPRTVFFWVDHHRRRELSQRMIELSEDLPAPYNLMIKARFFYSLENYAAAKDAFARYAEESPNTKGPGSYLDLQSVTTILQTAKCIDKNFWPEVTYEILSEGEPCNEPVIIISANERYFQLYLENYLRSLSMIHNIGHVHMHLFGNSNSTRLLIKKLSIIVPRYRVTFSSEPIVLDHPYFFASGRFLRIQEWQENFRSPIIMTDIDSLWGQSGKGPPSLFFENIVGDADVGLDLRSRVVVQPLSNSPIPGNRYPSADPWHSVWAGKVFLSGSVSSSQFAKILSSLACHQLRRASEKNAEANWFIDQNLLAAAYGYAVRNQPTIKFADLSDNPSAQGEHWLGRKIELTNQHKHPQVKRGPL